MMMMMMSGKTYGPVLTLPSAGGKRICGGVSECLRARMHVLLSLVSHVCLYLWSIQNRRKKKNRQMRVIECVMAHMDSFPHDCKLPHSLSFMSTVRIASRVSTWECGDPEDADDRAAGTLLSPSSLSFGWPDRQTGGGAGGAGEEGSGILRSCCNQGK